MEIENIKQLIKIAKEEGLTELKYENKDFKVTVNLAGTPVAISHLAAPANSTPTIQQAVSHTPAPAVKYHEVCSPFVGTYYSSPAPDKPTFVKVGDKVTKGQTLCILEAMKIMNEIEADASGEIVEICVENESLVEYGQCLFKIK